MSIDRVALSRRLSYVLRHAPERHGLVLDAEGFAPIADVLAALSSDLPGVVEADVRAVIAEVEPDKQRFAIVEGDIRANYGHSIAARVVQVPAEPPALLHHGTSTRFLESILAGGLRPMRRQYVHLTTELELARRVGARHGPPRLVAVDAARAHRDGIVFYRANRAFWLADLVPAAYLSVS